MTIEAQEVRAKRQKLVSFPECGLDEGGRIKLLQSMLPNVNLFPRIDPHLSEVGKASVLNCLAFHACTLQRSEVHCKVHTFEKEVEQLSTQEVQIRAWPLPGRGFHSRGGAWIGKEYDDYLNNCIIALIFGFNDVDYGWTDENKKFTIEQCDKHVQYYMKFQGSKIVLTELNDLHGNVVPWLTNHFKYLAETIERVSFIPSGPSENTCSEVVFPWPRTGWASEQYSGDKFHLSRQGLGKWLVPAFRDFSFKLAKTHDLKKVMWLTDSTLQAHDYPITDKEQVNVFVLSMDGRENVVKVGRKDTVAMLKASIAWCDKSLQPENLGLRWLGQLLDNDRTIKSYNITEGSTIFMFPDVYGVTTSSSYFVSQDFFHERMDHAGGNFYEIALGVLSCFDHGDCGWLSQDGACAAWATTYHGCGLCFATTMAEHAFDTCKEVGIYSTPNLDLAFEYADAFEHNGKIYRAVMKNRIKTNQCKKATESGFFEFWRVPGKEDIRPCAIVVREESGFTDKEIGEARGHFTKFDADGNSVLDRNETLQLMNSLNPGLEENVLKNKVRQLFQKIDANGDGELSFDEFKVWFILQQRKGQLLRKHTTYCI